MARHSSGTHSSGTSLHGYNESGGGGGGEGTRPEDPVTTRTYGRCVALFAVFAEFALLALFVLFVLFRVFALFALFGMFALLAVFALFAETSLNPKQKTLQPQPKARVLRQARFGFRAPKP